MPHLCTRLPAYFYRDLGSQLMISASYQRNRRPSRPLTYTFTEWDAAQNIMRLVPSDSNSLDASSYTVSVALNLNPMLPLCYVTTISVEEDDDSLIPLAEFELVFDSAHMCGIRC